eukprot:11579515-Karenia_brevis.AAC.1
MDVVHFPGTPGELLQQQPAFFNAAYGDIEQEPAGGPVSCQIEESQYYQLACAIPLRCNNSHVQIFNR